MDENPITETVAAAAKARPETVNGPGLPEKVSQLRQKLGQKAKQEQCAFQFLRHEVPVLCVVRPDQSDGCVGNGMGTGAKQ